VAGGILHGLVVLWFTGTVSFILVGFIVSLEAGSRLWFCRVDHDVEVCGPVAIRVTNEFLARFSSSRVKMLQHQVEK
jgi:hypothetical protein